MIAQNKRKNTIASKWAAFRADIPNQRIRYHIIAKERMILIRQDKTFTKDGQLASRIRVDGCPQIIILGPESP
jgi:hypothetical protein